MITVSIHAQVNHCGVLGSVKIQMFHIILFVHFRIWQIKIFIMYEKVQGSASQCIQLAKKKKKELLSTSKGGRGHQFKNPKRIWDLCAP